MHGKDLTGVKNVVKKLAVYTVALQQPSTIQTELLPGIRIGTDIQHTSTKHLRKYRHF
jgi:hypothetical protein